MKNIKVSYLNIDDLYLDCCEVLNDSNFNRRMFGSDLNKLLNNSAITFFIEDINEFEYIILKQISTDVSPFARNYNEEIYNNMNFSDISRYVKEVKTLCSDQIGEKYEDYYLPSGCIPGNCIAKFSGMQLANLMGGNPAKFFVEVSNKKCLNDDGTGLDESYALNLFEKDETLNENDNNQPENILISKFISYLYKALNSKLLNIDLLSDAMVFNKLHKYLKEDDIVLYNISEYGYDINFIEDDKKGILNILLENLKITKENFCTFGYSDEIIKDKILNDIKFQFIINTNFGSYFELFNLLPLKAFTCEESLTIPNKTNKQFDDIPIPNDLSGFTARIKSKEVQLLKGITDSYSTAENFIKFSELTPNFAKYTFSITLSLNDINLYLADYVDNISNNPNYNYQNARKIIFNIIKYTRSIYDFLIKNLK